jgi:large subunit ribosomal protein L13
MNKVIRTIHEIDATNIILGKLAVQIAVLLRGKHKVDFDYHLDIGDKVIVTNAGQIKLTGNKLEQKDYKHYSGYPGGLKTKKISDLLKEKPEEVIRRAVYDMLPKNRLRKDMIKRLTFK